MNNQEDDRPQWDNDECTTCHASPGYCTCDNEEPVNNLVAEASMVECNHGGIEVANVTSESLWWRRNWGDDAITEWKEAEIMNSQIDNDGESFENGESEPFFYLEGDGTDNTTMYFLKDFMRYDR
jgi:hypothetical protein